MSKLGNLDLDSETVSALESCKIYSVSDIIQADIDTIVANSNLDPERILALQHKLITDYAAHPTTAYDYFTKQNNTVIETGISSLDKLLEGGLNKGSILELCGLSGCGKTQICLSLAIQAAIRRVNVEYIDTKLDFSASRCNALLPPGISYLSMDEILGNISVSSPQNMYELISKLYALKNNFEMNPDEDKIVILDSITVPYLSFVGTSSNKGISLLNHVALTLKLLSKWNCAVVITNLGAQYFETEDEDEQRKASNEIKPMLGKYWAHVPDTRILITREDASEIRNLTIIKSCGLPINKTTEVNVSEKGVT